MPRERSCAERISPTCVGNSAADPCAAARRFRRLKGELLRHARPSPGEGGTESGAWPFDYGPPNAAQLARRRPALPGGDSQEGQAWSWRKTTVCRVTGGAGRESVQSGGDRRPRQGCQGRNQSVGERQGVPGVASIISPAALMSAQRTAARPRLIPSECGSRPAV
jgi:hypothetical protein